MWALQHLIIVQISGLMFNCKGFIVELLNGDTKMDVTIYDLVKSETSQKVLYSGCLFAAALYSRCSRFLPIHECLTPWFLIVYNANFIFPNEREFMTSRIDTFTENRDFLANIIRCTILYPLNQMQNITILFPGINATITENELESSI